MTAPDLDMHAKRVIVLTDRSRLVWRRVAAHGPAGVTLATLREELAGQVDEEPVRLALQEMSKQAICEFKGAGSRWGRWFINPLAIPLGEPAPAWLAAAQHDAEVDAADAPTKRSRIKPPQAGGPAAGGMTLPPAPASVFNLAAHTAATRSASTSAQPACPQPTGPHFALLSTGSLQLLCLEFIDGNDQPIAGSQSLTLGPQTTRALFAWLDRLGGTALSRLAEAA